MMTTFLLNNLFEFITLGMILWAISLQLKVLEGEYTSRLLKIQGVVSTIAFILFTLKCVLVLAKALTEFYTLLVGV